MKRLTPIAVGLFGATCALGSSLELAASTHPEWLPAAVRDGLEASLYGQLHADPVVHWWTRLSNLANLGAGIALVLLAGHLPELRRAVQIPLAWFIVSAVIGTIVVYGWVFPILEDVADFPVPVHVMQASMVGAPAGLIASAGLLIALVRRYPS